MDYHTRRSNDCLKASRNLLNLVTIIQILNCLHSTIDIKSLPNDGKFKEETVRTFRYSGGLKWADLPKNEFLSCQKTRKIHSYHTYIVEVSESLDVLRKISRWKRHCKMWHIDWIKCIHKNIDKMATEWCRYYSIQLYMYIEKWIGVCMYIHMPGNKIRNFKKRISTWQQTKAWVLYSLINVYI